MAGSYYYHKNCKRNYLRDPPKEPKSDTCVSQSQSQLRKELFIRTLPYIDKVLANDECCTVADLTEFACSMCDEGDILTNAFRPRDMKTLLSDHYGEDIQIIHNTIKSKSDIIFSSKIKPTDLALKIKNQNIMQECGKTLRHILMKVDFGLQDSFCLNPLPCELLTVCKCSGRCNTRRCRCRDKKARCTVFCHSKSSEPCVNMSDPV